MGSCQDLGLYSTSSILIGPYKMQQLGKADSGPCDSMYHTDLLKQLTFEN
jgi:hypothetical protein